MLLWIPELWKCAQFPTINANRFWQKLVFSILELLTHHIHFLHVRRLLINAWSSKSIWPVITSLCVPWITMWKHFISSLQMNVVDFIFQLLHIHNLCTLIVLTPFHSPCTPSTNNCAHLFIDYVNSSIDCINTYVDCINLFAERGNKSDDCANTFVNTLERLSLHLCIPNPSFLQLLFIDLLIIYKLKINIVLTVGSSIRFSSSILCILVFIFHNLHLAPSYYIFCLNST
jgi:hypothetical protein